MAYLFVGLRFSQRMNFGGCLLQFGSNQACTCLALFRGALQAMYTLLQVEYCPMLLLFGLVGNSQQSLKTDISDSILD